MKDIEPLVSVCCITYNHEDYIRDAIEGFLIQKTSFPIEIIIHDDASTDNTAQIIKEYEDKYPDLFVTILQSENQWSKGGGSIYARFVYPRARGKYIALCEGDDYWTDPLKLQKQVDFLEDNSDYGLVHTGYKTSSGNEILNKKFNITGFYLEDFLTGKRTIGTLTMLFRRYLYESTPKLYKLKQFKVGDLPLRIELANISKIGYINECTAMYRILEESASHDKRIEKEIDFQKETLFIRLFYIKYYQLHYLRKESFKTFYSVVLKKAYYKHNINIANIYFRKLCKLGFPNIKSIIFYFGTKYQFFNKLFLYLESRKNQ
ncbi:MAG TPA: glycosyltransferase [Gallicola sp.]|nr:glycosyltransferase [Gallicola sp.]